MFITSIQRYLAILHNLTAKQYENNIFIRRRARSLHASRTPTTQVLAAAQCTSTVDFLNVK